MALILLVAISLALLLLLAKKKLPLYAWGILIAAATALLYRLGLNGVLAAFLLAIDALLFMLFGVPRVRKLWLSGPLLKVVRRSLPPMSATEREAVAAGTVWWEAELFRGNPNWSQILALPPPSLSDQERGFLDGPVETLCAMLDDWRINHDLHDLPEEVWRFLKEHGFFGMIIPQSYGGLGFSALAHSEVIQKIASRSVAVAVTVMVPNSLGPAELLLAYGTDKQKRHYLPRLARGEEIPCFALTGPEAGSDAAAIPDTGIVNRRMWQGQETLGLLLNWEKRYITLGPVATVIGLAFHAYDPDHLLGEAEDLGITLALVPSTTPGIDIGDRHDPMGIGFQNGPNRGRDVFVPLDWIIGGAEMLGQGWSMLMERLAVGRGISLPSLSVAAGKLAADTCGAYALVRHQFKLAIGRFEGVQEPLARIGGLTYLMDAGRRLTVAALDRGEKPSVVTAIAKHYLTETMRQVVNDAMDIHGGRGISLGPANYLGLTYQALPVAITVEGANILTRSLILFGQGAMRCHPYLAEEIAAANLDDPEEGLDRFDRTLTAHLGYTLGNAARAFVYGVSGNLLAPSPVKGKTARYFRQLNRFSAAFAAAADLALLLLGGALKRKESLSGRFADALGYLYLASAVLKRFEDDGRPPEDRVLVCWAAEYALYRVQEALDGIARNFPNRLAALKIRAWALPLGRRLRPPADDLNRELAGLLLAPSASRDRLVGGIYRSRDPKDPTGILHYAMDLVIRAAPLEKSLRNEGWRRNPLEMHEEWLVRLIREKKITEEEARLLREKRKATLEAIRVDEFRPDGWTGRAAAVGAERSEPARTG